MIKLFRESVQKFRDHFSAEKNKIGIAILSQSGSFVNCFNYLNRQKLNSYERGEIIALLNE